MADHSRNNGQAVLVPDDIGRSLVSQLSAEERNILSKRIAIGASETEVELFLKQAKGRAKGSDWELDPWAMPPEVWLIPRRTKVGDQWVTQYIPQKAKDGALRQAKRRGVYHGHRIEHRVGDQWYDDGDEPEADHPERSRCTMFVPGGNNRRFVARWGERAQYRADGQLTEFWRRQPFEMLAKCALVGALKLLDESDAIEIADEEFDDEGLAQRRFWVRVDETGHNENDVRAALNVREGESLSEAVQRAGGWGRVEPRVLALFEARPTAYLGEADHQAGSAADLYTPDETGDQSQPPAPPHGERPSEAAPPPDDDGYRRFRQDLEADPPAKEQQSHGPTLDASVRDPSEFATAAWQAFDLKPADLDRILGADWRKQAPREYPALWQKLAEAKASA